jgi:hypothetical protein
VTATEVSPLRVNDELPSEIAVVPIVSELLSSAAFGMLEKFVPVSDGAVLYEGVVPPTSTPELAASIAVTPSAVW